MILTEDDMNQLEPFIDEIKAVAISGGRFNIAIIPMIDQIKFNRTGVRTKLWCGACVRELYNDIYAWIEETRQ